MAHITLLDALDWAARICLVFSVLNAILPPYDVLNDFPTAQKYYRLVLAIVKYFSGDVRTKIMQLYPSFTASDTGVAAVKQDIKDARAAGEGKP
jgi:hypothetical protein